MYLRDVSNLLVRLYHTRQAVELISPPGVGKSSVVEQVCARLSGKDYLAQPVGLMTFMLATIEPVDVRGFMIPQKVTNEDGTTSYASSFSTPPLIPTPGAFRDARSSYKVFENGRLNEDGIAGVPDVGVVFLDERAQASNDVQKPAADFMLNKRIGQFALPEGWTVWAASNRTKDASGVNRTLRFLQNRFCQIDVQPHLDSWVQWAERAGIHPMAIAFAKWKPGIVFSDAVPEKDGPFCTPRSLVMATQALQALALDPDDMTLPYDGALPAEVVAGWIGGGAASEFMTFMRIAADLPSFDDIVADPNGIPIPTDRPDIIFAMSQMLAHKVTKETAYDVFQFVVRLPREFQVGTLQATLRTVPEVLTNTKFSHWLRENKALVMAANVT